MKEKIVIKNKKDPILKQILKVFFKAILGLLFFFTVFGFIIPSTLSLFWGKDEIRRDDQDLLLNKVNTPKDQNIYFDLLKLNSEIRIEIPKEIDENKYLESYNWDFNIVSNFLVKNRKALELYNIISQKSEFQNEITSDPKNINFEMEYLNFGKLRQLSRINSIKAIYLLKQGKEKEAFEESFKSIIIGYNIEKSKNTPLIDYLVGLAVKEIGLETMQVLINYTTLPTNYLTKYQNELKKYYSVENDDPLKTEYMIRRQGLNFIANGLFEKTLKNNNFYFKPNKTANSLADNFRKIIKEINKECSDKLIAIEEREINISPKFYFTENLIGKLLVDFRTSGPLISLRNKKCHIDTMINATDILLAIKKYFLINNTYPTNLKQLVPKYIDKLPIDPYSENDFIFNPEEKIIYSIGKDYKDNGGSEEIKQYKLMDEPTFSYSL